MTIVNTRNGCLPIGNANVEIWQCDATGSYSEYAQPAFNGTGQTFLRGVQTTDANGQVTFRTIYPGWYSGRATHIHVQVKVKGKEKFTTQCYIKGDPHNERDGVLRSIRDPKARESVIVDFAPIEGSKIGELAAKFNIVLGFTPEA